MVSDPTPLDRQWILWHHKKDDTRWGIDSYRKIGPVIKTVEDFWTTMNSIGTVTHDMFFLMGAGIDPTYEAKQHRNGGAWLYKIHKTVTDNVWLHLCKLLVCGQITSHPGKITGISVSPKYSYVTIRVWNSDINLRTATGFHFSDLPIKNLELDSKFIYQPHDPKRKELQKFTYRHPSLHKGET